MNIITKIALSVTLSMVHNVTLGQHLEQNFSTTTLCMCVCCYALPILQMPLQLGQGCMYVANQSLHSLYIMGYYSVLRMRIAGWLDCRTHQLQPVFSVITCYAVTSLDGNYVKEKLHWGKLHYCTDALFHYFPCQDTTEGTTTNQQIIIQK